MFSRVGAIAEKRFDPKARVGPGAAIDRDTQDVLLLQLAEGEEARKHYSRLLDAWTRGSVARRWKQNQRVAGALLERDALDRDDIQELIMETRGLGGTASLKAASSRAMRKRRPAKG